MKRPLVLLLPALLVWSNVVLPARAAKGDAKKADPNLAKQAYGILKQYCYRCHGAEEKVPGFQILNHAGLLKKPEDADDNPKVTPGKPEKSMIWERLGVEKDMPPSGRKPTDEERLVIKEWIKAGALPPPADEIKRTFKSEQNILAAIQNDLRKKYEREDRRFQRYFTFTHLYNNRGVRPEELRLYRAALSKLVNSLSWESRIFVPRAIDKEETIYNVDLRKLGWDRHDLWREILKAYPYGLAYDESQDKEKQDLAKEVYDMTGSTVPYLRADWFIATASRPPLYHTVLELPTNAKVLEKQLRVNVVKDFYNDKVARAGFTQSGVSRNNRLVDRHPASNGSAYYWKSYDFKTNEGRGDLTRFPLGPQFRGHPFANQAFEQAGGEVIFGLPNGLQGYMLIDTQDNRIDKGPIDIVRDPKEVSGTPEVVNGISCMYCHQHGMIRFKDVLRQGHGVLGKARLKVERLFRKSNEMDELLKDDEDRFLAALDKTIGPFLKVGEDKDRKIRSFKNEPVAAIATLYINDLRLEDVARELDYKDPAELADLIKKNPRLGRLGLRPLVQDSGIKRELWQSQTGTYSLYQKVALELEIGTPYRIRR